MTKHLTVKTFGTGPSRFIALHGWGGSHATFSPLIPHIPESTTLDAIDLPGFGTSKQPDVWKIDRIAEMVVESIQFKGEYTVVGNCTGGVIGAELALMRPKSVHRLIMIDPFAFAPWYFSLFLKGTFGRNAYRTTFASPIGRFFMNRALQSKRDKNSDLTASFKHINHDVAYAFLKMMGDHEGPSRYAGLNLPIEIILGENTFGAVKKSAEILKRIWPQARIRTISGAGHLPLEERPNDIAESIFRYG
jgi:pimeloyl-ACP methyl ester carboxylesterase